MSELPPGFFDDETPGDELPPGFFGDDDDGVDGKNPASGENHQQQQEASAKAREWIQHNNRRYKQRAAYNAATRAATAAERFVPPEFLRKAFKDHGDLSDPRFKDLRRTYIQQLRFLPLAIHKFLENIPMPWEAARYVNVLYHVSGALTLVDDTPMVCEPLYVAQWATTWSAMQQYRRENTPFPTLLAELGSSKDFAEPWVLDQDPLPPIRLDMADMQELEGVEDWFYEAIGSAELPKGAGTIDPKRSARWRLGSHTLAALQRLAADLCSDNASNDNYFYLWNQADFKNAKVLGINLPGAPRFRQHHPLNQKSATGAADSSSSSSNNKPTSAGDLHDDAAEEDITEFNDPTKRIIRGKILKEVELAFPFLYGQQRVEHCSVTPYHEQHDVGGLRLDDLSDKVAPFYWNSAFHPIKAVRGAPQPSVDDLFAVGNSNAAPAAPAAADADSSTVAGASGGCELPALFSPFLSDDTCLDDMLTAPTAVAAAVAAAAAAEDDDADLQQKQSNKKNSKKDREDAAKRRVAAAQEVKAAMTLLSARGTAFCQAQGTFKRAQDVKIAEQWCRERCPRPCPKETGDSYAFLLRKEVLREFSAEKERDLRHEKARQAAEEKAATLAEAAEAVAQALEEDLVDDDDDVDGAAAAASAPAGIAGGGGPSDVERKIRNLASLAQSKYYQRTRIEWLEAGMMLVRQAHTMVKLLLSFRNMLQFIEVGKNFSLEMKITPSTKIRKKTRLGKTILFLCELLRVVKAVVDVHVKYRSKECDAFQLADGVAQIFGQVENISAMYREKLSVKKQAIEAKHWMNLVESRFLGVDALMAAAGIASGTALSNVASNNNNNTASSLRNNNNNNNEDDDDGANQQQQQQNKSSAIASLIAATGVSGQGVSATASSTGAGFWHPMWKVWVNMCRGMAPLLESHIENLLTRLFAGRRTKGLAKRTTKQRVESEFDVNQVADFRLEATQMLPAGLNAEQAIRRLLAHLGEAWRCWKKNEPWVEKVRGLEPPMREDYIELIMKYVRRKSDRFVRVAMYNRERICRGLIRDKAVYDKNLQQLTRLKLKQEQERQLAYMRDGPALTPTEMGDIHSVMARWLSSRGFQKIEFPKANNIVEQEICNTMLQRIRQQNSIQPNKKLTSGEKEFLLKIEESLDQPGVALTRMVEQLRAKRIFKPVHMGFADLYNLLTPVYTVDAEERVLDTFLDAYLWHTAQRLGLFPNWVKPSDAEPAPVLAYKLCTGLNNLPGFWDTADDEAVVLLQAQLEGFYDNIDWHIMSSLLKLVMDPDLVSYIRARHNVEVKFKDMKYLHQVGLIRGFAFAGFVAQLWGLACDLMLLGPKRAGEMAGPPGRPNPIFSFSGGGMASQHPIVAYLRYHDRVTIALKYDRAQADDLVDRFLAAEPVPENSTVVGYKNKKCWPREHRMKLVNRDVSLGRAALWDFRNRLPPGVAAMSWDSPGTFASVYSVDNPNLLLDLAGFEVRILPACRCAGGDAHLTEAAWALRSHTTREITAVAYIQVTAEHVEHIKNRLRQGLISLGNATFEKIAKRWNALVTELVPYYREAILGTAGLQAVFTKSESDFQNRIKGMLNSRKPERFPPCIFYAPADLGGLGMVSIGGAMIPVSDMGGRQAAHFVRGLTTGAAAEQRNELPNIFRVFPAWGREFADSQRAWAEWRRRLAAAQQQRRRLSIADVQDIGNLGIPRIHTNFSHNREVYKYDCGWRLRQEWQVFAVGRNARAWWYHPERDGKLEGNQKDYQATMLQALGGAEAVLEHSLFKATGIQSWDALYWEDKGNTFEDKARQRGGATHHQTAGLIKVTNQRLAMWWSPTINRRSVYGGKPKQIERTGVLLRGKLAMIDTSMRNVFKQDLWTKIHDSLCNSIAAALNAKRDDIGAREATRKDVPPRKSYHTESSLADIVLQCATRGWKLSSASPLSVEVDRFDMPERQPRIFVDVQIRWGDYDAHDPERLARELFNLYTSQRLYADDCGCERGVVLAIDLAYCTFSAYGHWVPGLKPLLRDVVRREMAGNKAMTALRTRVKLQLEIRTTDPTAMQALNKDNFNELFGEDQTTWIVDNTQVLPMAQQKTGDGNVKKRVLNGALLILNPKTGKLFVSIIHKSTFEGQRRRPQLAREKAAEQVSTWLLTIPANERPQRIVCVMGSFLSTLNCALFEYPNIAIQKTELALPTSKLLMHDRLGEMVRAATESRTLMLNAYDDWPSTLQPAECFARLNWVLRCTSVAPERVRKILWPDRGVEQRVEHFWPTLEPEAWRDAQEQCCDIILTDFAIVHNKRVKDLTKAECISILLGQRIKVSDIEDREVQELLEQTKAGAAAAAGSAGAQQIETRMINRVGEEVVVRSKKVVAARGSAADSRADMARGAKLLREDISGSIFLFDAMGTGAPSSSAAAAAAAGSGGVHIVILKQQLKRLMSIVDTRVAVVALLYGTKVPPSSASSSMADATSIGGGGAGATERWLVDSIVLPQQKGSINGAVTTPNTLPDTERRLERGHELVAVFRTQGDGDPPLILESDLAFAARMVTANPQLDPMLAASAASAAAASPAALARPGTAAGQQQQQQRHVSPFAKHGFTYIIAGIAADGISLHCATLTTAAMKRGAQRVDRVWTSSSSSGGGDEIPPVDQSLYYPTKLEIVQRADRAVPELYGPAGAAAQKQAQRQFHLGSFLVPVPGSWNYFFRDEADWPEQCRLEMDVAPLPFADSSHRPGDFLDFAALVQRASGEHEADLAE